MVDVLLIDVGRLESPGRGTSFFVAKVPEALFVFFDLRLMNTIGSAQ
jgi:hypothetical protein